LQRFGKVQVGEFGNILGLDDIDGGGRCLFDAQCAVQTGAETGHHDFGGGGFFGDGRGRFLRHDGGSGNNRAGNKQGGLRAAADGMGHH
jgi:hypothetical protein